MTTVPKWISNLTDEIRHKHTADQDEIFDCATVERLIYERYVMAHSPEKSARSILTVDRLVRILENAWSDIRTLCPGAWDSMDELEDEIAKLTHETSVEANKRLMKKHPGPRRPSETRSERDAIRQRLSAADALAEAVAVWKLEACMDKPLYVTDALAAYQKARGAS